MPFKGLQTSLAHCQLKYNNRYYEYTYSFTRQCMFVATQCVAVLRRQNTDAATRDNIFCDRSYTRSGQSKSQVSVLIFALFILLFSDLLIGSTTPWPRPVPIWHSRDVSGRAVDKHCAQGKRLASETCSCQQMLSSRDF